MGERRFQVSLAPAAQRQLAKLGVESQHRIVRALHGLELDPRPPGAVQLVGSHGGPRWRARVGDYRVIYEIQDDRLLVLVIRIGHRSEVYRGR